MRTDGDAHGRTWRSGILLSHVWQAIFCAGILSERFVSSHACSGPLAPVPKLWDAVLRAGRVPEGLDGRGPARRWLLLSVVRRAIRLPGILLEGLCGGPPDPRARSTAAPGRLEREEVLPDVRRKIRCRRPCVPEGRDRAEGLVVGIDPPRFPSCDAEV